MSSSDRAGVDLAAQDGTGSKVDLLQEEALGGHTISQHVGKSDEFLLNRVRDFQNEMQVNQGVDVVAGSFSSINSANNLVSSTLAQNASTVDAVANGDLLSTKIQGFFSSPTGNEAFASNAVSSPYIRDTYSVTAILKHDDRLSNGFYILTAFPSAPYK